MGFDRGFRLSTSAHRNVFPATFRPEDRDRHLSVGLRALHFTVDLGVLRQTVSQYYVSHW